MEAFHHPAGVDGLAPFRSDSSEDRISNSDHIPCIHIGLMTGPTGTAERAANHKAA